MAIDIKPGSLFREPLTGTLFMPLDDFDGEITGSWLDDVGWPFDVGVFTEMQFEQLLEPANLEIRPDGKLHRLS